MNSIAIFESIWPTTAEGWAGLLVFVVGFVAAIAALIPTARKLIKKGAELVKDKNWSKIKEIALAAMKEAEASGKKGSEKQQMVIDEDLKNLVKYINETIEWFNGMNESSKAEEASKSKDAKQTRKFLVTKEEEKELNQGK